MSSKKRISHFGAVVTAFSMSLLSAWYVTAAAQETNRPAIVSERNIKAWETQAKTVAASLTLSAEQTTKLVEVYRAARDSHTTAADAVAGPAERPDLRKMRQVNQAERAKFETALQGFLNQEQTEKALLTLGSFFRRWDGMVEVLEGMHLADKPREEVLKLTADYVAQWNKAMQVAIASGNKESMREQANELKDKLDAEVAKFLSPEQMAKWTDATGKRGPRHE